MLSMRLPSPCVAAFPLSLFLGWWCYDYFYKERNRVLSTMLHFFGWYFLSFLRVVVFPPSRFDCFLVQKKNQDIWA